MLEAIWIYPPLAFARLGSSPQPLDCFHWGPNDVRPRGTGKTTILPAETLYMQEDGTIESSTPATVQFKDEEGFRPVCPFFELHGRWRTEEDTVEGPITPEVLAQFGLNSSSLRWVIKVGNYKAYFMSQDAQNAIVAELEIVGDDTGVKILRGQSPEDAAVPLIPLERYIPLGSVRLVKPSEEFPEVRLRFTPARGNFYGPTNFESRGVDWRIPEENLFLNEKSSWCNWKPSADDPRGTPGGQYAQDDDGVSLGLVDDVCDGIITCQIEGEGNLTAHARITVGPPDYAPDRRHIVSLADGLKDRVDRQEVHHPGYVRDSELTSLEIRDMMERVLETMGLVNVDVFNNRVDVQENPEIAFTKGIPYKKTEHKAFVPPVRTKQQPFPLTELGRQHHRRFVSIEVFENFMRQRPELIDEWIRPPVSDDPFFTNKMPAVMRGASGEPLHLTRRQYDLLVAWARHLRESVNGGS